MLCYYEKLGVDSFNHKSDDICEYIERSIFFANDINDAKKEQKRATQISFAYIDTFGPNF